MKSGEFYFYLILNTEGKTSWEYESPSEWEPRFNDLIAKTASYNLCNNDGYFEFKKITFELKNNRLKVDSGYVLYDKFTKDFCQMFYDYTQGVTGSVVRAFRENNFNLRNTDIFWFNADTIIFDDEPLEGVWYKLEVTDIDYSEAEYLINKLSAE